MRQEKQMLMDIRITHDLADLTKLEKRHPRYPKGFDTRMIYPSLLIAARNQN